MKRRLNEFANGIELCKPAQSTPADIGQNFSLTLNFLRIKEPSSVSQLFNKMDFMDP